MSEEETDTFVINEAEAGERLDKILSQRFKEIRSRTYFQMLIEEHKVLVNGIPVKKRYQPHVGDEIQIHFIVTPEIGLEPEPIPLNIIYEDDYIIAVNKPVGMVVHPAVGNWTGTFVNALLYHCRHVYEMASGASILRPGIVHRLDKDTSGLLIAAKTTKAHQKLIEMFASRSIHKEYLVICIGNPGNVEISAPIGRHPIHRQMMSVNEKGREALTICKMLAKNDKFSLVQVTLATGRTHQIRVHLKHLGTPVLGDTIYGNASINEKHGVKRQLLHAHRLIFIHPITGKSLNLDAPPPEDMAAWIKKLLG